MKPSAGLPMTLLMAMLPIDAQLPAPNADGVAMGHLHLSTTDAEASRKFWVDAMGGTPVKFGGGEVYKFPDVIVIATKKPSVSGGSEGSLRGSVCVGRRDGGSGFAAIRRSAQ